MTKNGPSLVRKPEFREFCNFGHRSGNILTKIVLVHNCSGISETSVAFEGDNVFRYVCF